VDEIALERLTSDYPLQIATIVFNALSRFVEKERIDVIFLRTRGFFSLLGGKHFHGLRYSRGSGLRPFCPRNRRRSNAALPQINNGRVIPPR
jgi:hypothetical protein